MERLKTARLITAIKTPYLPNGDVDLETYDTFITLQIQNGVEGVIVGGTTGEGHLMSWHEHIMLIGHTVQFFGDQLIVIGNTGSNNTREAVEATYEAFAIGMHASLQINPYYGKTSQEGLKHHFKKVFDLGPAIVYNVPSRTGQDILPELMLELAEHQNFIGIKECQGPERIGNYTSQGIRCWSGNDDDSFDSRHHHGANGVISVTSNIVPGLMKKLMVENNPALLELLKPLMAWLFIEPNPIGLNTALAMTGMVNATFRLPYFPYDIEKRKDGLKIMSEIGLEHLAGDHLQLLEDQSFNIV